MFKEVRIVNAVSSRVSDSAQSAFNVNENLNAVLRNFFK